MDIKKKLLDFFGYSSGRGATMVKALYVERENAIQIK